MVKLTALPGRMLAAVPFDAIARPIDAIIQNRKEKLARARTQEKSREPHEILEHLKFLQKNKVDNKAAVQNKITPEDFMKMLAVTPEERAVREKKWQLEDQKKAFAKSTDLCVERLKLLPEGLDKKLKLLKISKIMTTALVRDLWQALENNTDHLNGQWDFVPPEAPPVVSSEVGPPPPVVQKVISRFTDIDLVRPSAIRDPFRSTNSNSEHFLHANEVNLRCGKPFIASQKPMEAEIPGFHQMLFDKNVGLIVDLTRPEEKEQSARYAPDKGDPIQPHALTKVECKKSRWLGQPKSHLKQLTIQSGSKKCTVDRLHFKGWPDHGVVDTKTLIQLADKVEELSPDVRRPVLIHCRAGVGRTGSLMSFIAARRKINEAILANGDCCTPQMIVNTMMDVIAKGRIDRGPCFVQNKEQFELVLGSLVEAFADKLQEMPIQTSTESPKSIAEIGRQTASPRQNLDSASSLSNATLRNWLQPSVDASNKRRNLSAKQVGSNTVGVACPEVTALSVMLRNEDRLTKAYLHANEITFSRAPFATASKRTIKAKQVAVAGQSPQEFGLCERFLLRGLISGQGLFQFVSPHAHLHPEQDVEKPVIAQLRERLAEASASGIPVVLGGRYMVTTMENIPCEGDDTYCVKVTAEDMVNRGKTKTILLTQAGLRFDDNRLRGAEIERAHELVNLQVNTQQQFVSREVNDPIIVSYSGIGRNATLICYREALRRLDEVKNEADLDSLLDQIVRQGRQDRGPGFIHSKGQFDELKGAVLKQYRLKNEPVASATSFRQPPVTHTNAVQRKKDLTEAHLPKIRERFDIR